jgi:hypothetical protein
MAARTPPHDVLGQLDSTEDGLVGTVIAERLARLGPNIVGSHRVRALTVLGMRRSLRIDR